MMDEQADGSSGPLRRHFTHRCMHTGTQIPLTDVHTNTFEYSILSRTGMHIHSTPSQRYTCSGHTLMPDNHRTHILHTYSYNLSTHNPNQHSDTHSTHKGPSTICPSLLSSTLPSTTCYPHISISGSLGPRNPQCSCKPESPTNPLATEAES